VLGSQVLPTVASLISIETEVDAAEDAADDATTEAAAGSAAGRDAAAGTQPPCFEVGDLVEVASYETVVKGANKTNLGGVGKVSRVRPWQEQPNFHEVNDPVDNPLPRKGSSNREASHHYDVRYMVGASRGATWIAEARLTQVPSTTSLELEPSGGGSTIVEDALSRDPDDPDDDDDCTHGSRCLRSTSTVQPLSNANLKDGHRAVAHTGTAVRAALNSRAFAAIASVERSLMRLPGSGSGSSGGGFDGGVQKLASALNSAARKRNLSELQSAAEQLSDYCLAAAIALGMV
jgi:hypothetical protein